MANLEDSSLAYSDEEANTKGGPRERAQFGSCIIRESLISW